MKKFFLALVMGMFAVSVNAASTNDTAEDMEMIMDLAETFLDQTDRDKLDKLEALTNTYLEKKNQLKRYEEDYDLENTLLVMTSCKRDLDAIILILEELDNKADKMITEIQNLGDENSSDCHVLKAKVVVFREFTSYIAEKICGKR